MQDSSGCQPTERSISSGTGSSEQGRGDTEHVAGVPLELLAWLAATFCHTALYNFKCTSLRVCVV